MKRAIFLHGALREQFGGPFHLNVASAAEAGRALAVVLPGFRKAVIGNQYRVIRATTKRETDLGMGDLALGLGRAELHIVPVVAGSKSGAGIGKIVLGLALVASAFVFAPAALGAGAAFGGGAGFAAGAGATGLSAGVFGSAVTFGNVAIFGAGLALAGISQLIAPSPKAGSYADLERPDQRPSFLFNGAVNTSEQGGPVPVACGRFGIGTKVISAGMVAEQI